MAAQENVKASPQFKTTSLICGFANVKQLKKAPQATKHNPVFIVKTSYFGNLSIILNLPKTKTIKAVMDRVIITFEIKLITAISSIFYFF